MIDKYEFHAEPVVGHHVGATVTEPDGPLTTELDEIADQLDINTRDRRKVTIEVGDVVWDETKEVTVPLRTFKQIAEWVSECTDD